MKIGSKLLNEDPPSDLLTQDEVEKVLRDGGIAHLSEFLTSRKDMIIDDMFVICTLAKAIANSLGCFPSNMLMSARKIKSMIDSGEERFFKYDPKSYKHSDSTILFRDYSLEDLMVYQKGMQHSNCMHNTFRVYVIIPKEGGMRPPTVFIRVSLQRYKKNIILVQPDLGYVEPTPKGYYRNNYFLAEGVTTKYKNTGTADDGTPDESVLEHYSDRHVFCNLLTTMARITLTIFIKFAKTPEIKHSLEELNSKKEHKLLHLRNKSPGLFDLIRVRFSKIEAGYDFCVDSANSKYLETFTRLLFENKRERLSKMNKYGIFNKLRSYTTLVSYAKCNYDTTTVQRVEFAAYGSHAANISIRKSAAINDRDYLFKIYENLEKYIESKSDLMAILFDSTDCGSRVIPYSLIDVKSLFLFTKVAASGKNPKYIRKIYNEVVKAKVGDQCLSLVASNLKILPPRSKKCFFAYHKPSSSRKTCLIPLGTGLKAMKLLAQGLAGKPCSKYLINWIRLDNFATIYKGVGRRSSIALLLQAINTLSTKGIVSGLRPVARNKLIDAGIVTLSKNGYVLTDKIKKRLFKIESHYLLLEKEVEGLSVA